MRSGIIVLGYHGVALDEEIRDPWIQRVQTPISDFRSHLEIIGKHFEVISADETLESTRKKRRIHLTFDDGYTGFAEHALPLLEQYGFSASVYVVSGAATNSSRLPPYIGRAALGHCEPGRISLDSIGFTSELTGRKSRESAYSHISAVLKTGKSTAVSSLIDELIALLPADQWNEINQSYRTDQLMGWSTLKKVSEAGFTVGAHSDTHLSLSDQQSKEDIESEVHGSIETVRQKIGTCDWFAYPNGTAEDWSATAANAVKNAGVKGAWTLEPGVIRKPNELNHFRLPRFFVPRSLDRFKLLLNTALIRH
jgi:peptidoglycan/xylan/chitin deacetylase (PgdA/CDA1 family)